MLNTQFYENLFTVTAFKCLYILRFCVGVITTKSQDVPMWTRKGCHYIPQVDLCQGMYRAWIAFRHPVVFRPGHGFYCYANADNLKLDLDPNLVGVLPSNPPEAMSHKCA
jgi:hypothetical protein